MSGPIDSAAKGLMRAEAQLAQSASRLVSPPAAKIDSRLDAGKNAFAAKVSSKSDSENEPKKGVQTTQTSKRGSSSAAVTSQGSYLPSMAEEAVQMRIAANAYSTNARLMVAADDILKMTQDIIGSPSKAAGDPSNSE